MTQQSAYDYVIRFYQERKVVKRALQVLIDEYDYTNRKTEPGDDIEIAKSILARYEEQENADR